MLRLVYWARSLPWFFPKLRIFYLLPAWARMYFSIISELSAAYTNRWMSVLACLLISIVASAIVIIGIIFIAAAFPFAPDYLVTAIAGVFGNVLSAIPITPGGVGVGETAFASVCRKLTEMTAPFASIYLTFVTISHAPALRKVLWENCLRRCQLFC
ncbi:hypothetical protein FIC94_11165 [Ochrobactrum teleogrylli]|uniref:Flippase-like domain-containing protein n=2 Tax=Ochrobactrum teleogrylli TaxID=2479765 RepID=A0ABY2Y6H2_9HYPH|nr:hypothetical protein FIC94_11165 [[Ochrobactrum] teleogrylli]